MSHEVIISTIQAITKQISRISFRRNVEWNKLLFVCGLIQSAEVEGKCWYDHIKVSSKVDFVLIPSNI